MLDYTHDPFLVIVSLVVALMAGFTGLSLTRGASRLPDTQRKLMVAMAAVALGGGIWSMHFVAMLGLHLPVLFYYDALITLISALVVILMTGIALLLVHFGRRTRVRVILAGGVLGVGIPIMHYVGMAAMQVCRPVYDAGGIVLAVLVSVVLSVLAFLIAYDKRAPRNIVLGTFGFGLAVFAVHFTAMAGTGFVLQDGDAATGPLISNGALAFGVTLAVFVISGAFLLTGVTFVPVPSGPSRAAEAEASAPAPAPAQTMMVPFERDSRTQFVNVAQIAAIRAEGHYTLLYVGEERLFCPWSITQAEARVPAELFMRTHRSYLVNCRHVTGFERKKDTGLCLLEHVSALEAVPVSRARLSQVRAALGL